MLEGIVCFEMLICLHYYFKRTKEFSKISSFDGNSYNKYLKYLLLKTYYLILNF